MPFLDRTGPFCLFFTVFHCFLKLWFVFKFEWIISLNEYFWFNFEWIILLNEYSRFNFELNIELNHFFARFNVKMNNQNISATPSHKLKISPQKLSSKIVINVSKFTSLSVHQFISRGRRYVLIINFYVESGQKLIQFNIQFKIESKIFIQ